MQVTFGRSANRLLIAAQFGSLLVFLLACGRQTSATEAKMSPSILNSTEEQLRSAQAKITYLGEQTKPIATVVFHTSGHKVMMKDFAKLHRGGELYTNDELPYTRFFGVTPQEFSAVLRSLLPVLSDPAVSQGADFLSFTVLRKVNSKVEGQEFKIGSAAGKGFYQTILKALGMDNESGRQILQKQFFDVFPP